MSLPGVEGCSSRCVTFNYASATEGVPRSPERTSYALPAEWYGRAMRGLIPGVPKDDNIFSLYARGVLECCETNINFIHKFGRICNLFFYVLFFDLTQNRFVMKL